MQTLIKQKFDGKYGVGYQIHLVDGNYQLRIFKGSLDREIDRYTPQVQTLDGVVEMGNNEIAQVNQEIEDEGNRCG